MSNEIDIQQLHSDYIARHGQDVVVEYTSLEDLNRIFEENGVPTISLEEIGITQEQYDAAQASLLNGNVASPRCDDPVYQFLGDMNDNGILTAYDTVLAVRVILGIDPPSTASSLFGYISFYAGVGSPQLTNLDRIIAIRVVLSLPCDELV